ncbi:hypothetical protein [Chromobacterium sp. ASV23]|uniref:hypothetical protein n=1 Tax=Chromobacterium sp. ASV23 TaxID=2795110 RepID=UPI0018EA32AE|nr:hypothetical protein [Chromobacterium sp. ASV23]
MIALRNLLRGFAFLGSAIACPRKDAGSQAMAFVSVLGLRKPLMEMDLFAWAAGWNSMVLCLNCTNLYCSLLMIWVTVCMICEREIAKIFSNVKIKLQK